MSHILLTYILSIALLLFCGYGLTVYLMPDYLRKYNLFIMPAVGFSLINSISHLFGWFGWGSKDFFWIIILTAGLINIFAYIKVNPLRKSGRYYWIPSPCFRTGHSNGVNHGIYIKGNYFPIFCSIILFVICISPLLKIGNFTPVIGASGDFITYSLRADYLRENGLFFSSYNKYSPAFEQIKYYVSNGFSLGFDYFHSIIDLILGKAAYETISLISALFISYYCLAIYFLAETLFNPGKMISKLLIVLCVINPMLTGIHLDGYAAQAIGLDLLIILIGLSIFTLKHKNNGLLILSAFIASSLISTHPPLFLYYIAPMAVYSGVLLMRKNLDWKTFSILSVKTILLVFIFNPVGFIRSIRALNHITKGLGNVAEFIPFYEIFGLSHHITSSLLSPHFNLLILSIIILVSVFGIIRTTQDKRDILLSILLPYILFAIIIRYYHNYSYGYFKSLSISLFVLLIIFSIGIGEIIKLKRYKNIIISFVFTLAFFNIINQIKLLDFFKVNGVKIYSIEQFCNKVSSLVPADKSIYIANELDAKMLWMTYFLKERPVFINHFTPYPTKKKYPYYKHHIDDEYIILNKNVHEDISHMSIGKVINENEEYLLINKNPEVLFYKDTHFGLNTIVSGDQIKFNFDKKKTKINIESFPIKGNDLDEYEMSIGVYIPAGGKLELKYNDQTEILKNKDSGVKIINFSKLPINIKLKNIEKKEISLKFIKLIKDNRNNLKTNQYLIQSALDIYREKITPFSNAYVVSGWHLLENDKRWSKDKSLALIKNPFKKSKLIIKGTLPLNYYDKKPTIEISLNSNLIDRFTATTDSVKKEYIVSKEILGRQNWGEIEIKISPTFIPDEINHLGDKRNLGIMIDTLSIFDL